MMSASPAYRISKWVMIICHLRLPWLREQGSWDVLTEATWTILIIWIISPGSGRFCTAGAIDSLKSKDYTFISKLLFDK